MASLMEELITVLKDELECYKQLLNLSNEKTEIIVNGDVPKLQALTEEEQVLAGKVFRLDKKRENIISDISIVINKPSDELTITQLIQLLGQQGEEKEELTHLNENFKSILEELKSKNEQNSILLKQSLDFIDFTVNALRTSKNVPQTASYENKGQVASQNSNRSIFDAKQ